MTTGSTTRSETIAELLAKALSKAQGAISAAPKAHEAEVEGSNYNYSYRYADLAGVWEACRKPLTDNGLCVVQTSDVRGVNVTVTTLLLHASGEFISNDLVMVAAQATPQKVGSAITYGRRYALSALVGVCSEEDDDGKDASTGCEGRGAREDSRPPAKDRGQRPHPARREVTFPLGDEREDQAAPADHTSRIEQTSSAGALDELMAGIPPTPAHTDAIARRIAAGWTAAKDAAEIASFSALAKRLPADVQKKLGSTWQLASNRVAVRDAEAGTRAPAAVGVSSPNEISIEGGGVEIPTQNIPPVPAEPKPKAPVDLAVSAKDAKSPEELRRVIFLATSHTGAKQEAIHLEVAKRIVDAWGAAKTEADIDAWVPCARVLPDVRQVELKRVSAAVRARITGSTTTTGDAQ